MVWRGDAGARGAAQADASTTTITIRLSITRCLSLVRAVSRASIRGMGAVGEVDRAVHRRLCDAIEARRVIRFEYAGCVRVAEPHDYGVAGGEVKLFYYQVGG